jgi:hypothetical protein
MLDARFLGPHGSPQFSDSAATDRITTDSTDSRTFQTGSETRQANWDVVISPPISPIGEVGDLLARQIAELQERFALLE